MFARVSPQVGEDPCKQEENMQIPCRTSYKYGCASSFYRGTLLTRQRETNINEKQSNEFKCMGVHRLKSWRE